jgi:hypothetical protein
MTNVLRSTRSSRRLARFSAVAVLAAALIGLGLGRAAGSAQAAFISTTEAGQVPADVVAKIDELRARGESIKSVAFGENNAWVILYGFNGYAAHQVPVELNAKLQEVNARQAEIKSVAFAPHNGWVLLFGFSGFWAGNVPTSLSNKLHELYVNKNFIKWVAISPSTSSWVILTNIGGVYYDFLPAALQARLDDLKAHGHEFLSVGFRPIDDDLGYVDARSHLGWTVTYNP